MSVEKSIEDKLNHIKNFIENNNKYYNLDDTKLSESIKDKGLSGLVNLGNTCYMNTTIQCLSNTLPFTKHLLSGKFMDSINTKKKEFDFFYQFVRLLKAIWTENYTYEPKSFKKILGEFDHQFANFNQHDSHEVLITIINNIHSALSYEVTINIDGEPKNDLDKMMIESMKSWKRMFKNEYSVMNDIFYGQFHSTTRCTSCNHTNHTYDPFCYISLPIPEKANTIYECLESYSHKELLDTQNQWKCDGCKENTNAEKKIELWKTPEILIITLKRFNFRQQKINRMIAFPTTKPLYLQKWTHGYDKASSSYELYAISNHSGHTTGGHYYAFCKNNGKWYNYNDDMVQEINEEKIMTSNAYVLFYRKKH